MNGGSGVAVVVPVFNGAPFLGAALDSIAAQTLPPDEVIVVDDGSTDGSADLARTHAVVSAVIRQARAGPAAARNAGIAASGAPLLAFQDADDLWLPDKTARQVALLSERPDLSAAICLIDAFVEPGTPVDDVARDLLGPRRGTMAQCLMVRREVMLASGGFDGSLRARSEQAWFLDAERAGIAMGCVEDVLVRRRLHAANASRREAAVARGAFLELAARSIRRHRATAG